MKPALFFILSLFFVLSGCTTNRLRIDRDNYTFEEIYQILQQPLDFRSKKISQDDVVAPLSSQEEIDMNLGKLPKKRIKEMEKMMNLGYTTNFDYFLKEIIKEDAMELNEMFSGDSEYHFRSFHGEICAIKIYSDKNNRIRVLAYYINNSDSKSVGHEFMGEIYHNIQGEEIINQINFKDKSGYAIFEDKGRYTLFSPNGGMLFLIAEISKDIVKPK